MQDPRHPTGQPQQPGSRPTIQPHPPQHGAPTIRPQGPGLTPRPPAPAPVEEEPIALIDDDTVVEPQRSSTEEFTKKIKALGEVGVHKKQHDWKRKLHATGTGAIRVRSFHGKYSDQGLQYLDDAINEWLDANPEVEVKFVTSTVGVFEGKIREPALVLNLWY